MKNDMPERLEALAGIRVLDFSRVLAGPYATMMLGDLGADVIKVEGPSGDDTRQWKPPVDSRGHSTYFASVNRNKRAITLDLSEANDREFACNLIAGADVVVENFKAGGMAKFGLGFEEVSCLNPRVVYCSITGFGTQEGAGLPGYDLLVQAVGGLMSVTGEQGGSPTKVGVALVDVLTGLNAVVGIQAALSVREATGVGQHVEVNLLHSLLSALVNQASGALATGRAPVALGNAHPSIAPYEVFDTLAGSLAITVGNDRQFAALLTVLELDHLAEDPRFRHNSDRVAHRIPLRNALEGALRRRPAAAWADRLLEAGVPAGPVNDILDAIQLAASLGLDPVVELGASTSTTRVISNPISLSSTPARYRFSPPEQSARGERVSWAGQYD